MTIRKRARGTRLITAPAWRVKGPGAFPGSPRADRPGAVDDPFDSLRATYAIGRWERVCLVGVAAVMVPFGVYLIVGAAGSGFYLGVLAGLALSIFALWWALLAYAYVGAMSPDGQLWFRSILGEWSFHAEEVRRVAVHRGEGGAWFVIRASRGAVRISYMAGRPIVDSILAANPDVKVRGYEGELR